MLAASAVSGRRFICFMRGLPIVQYRHSLLRVALLVCWMETGKKAEKFRKRKKKNKQVDSPIHHCHRPITRAPSQSGPASSQPGGRRRRRDGRGGRRLPCWGWRLRRRACHLPLPPRRGRWHGARGGRLPHRRSSGAGRWADAAAGGRRLGRSRRASSGAGGGRRRPRRRGGQPSRASRGRRREGAGSTPSPQPTTGTRTIAAAGDTPSPAPPAAGSAGPRTRRRPAGRPLAPPAPRHRRERRRVHPVDGGAVGGGSAGACPGETLAEAGYGRIVAARGGYHRRACGGDAPPRPCPRRGAHKRAHVGRQPPREARRDGGGERRGRWGGVGIPR